MKSGPCEDMEKEGGPKMSKLCRICASPSDLRIPIFVGEGLDHNLADKIDKHLPIQVTQSDALPREVCYDCASTLCTWHDLVSKCVEADGKLKAMQDVDALKTDEEAGSSVHSDSNQKSNATVNTNVVEESTIREEESIKTEKVSSDTVPFNNKPKPSKLKDMEQADLSDLHSSDSSERCGLATLTSFMQSQKSQNAARLNKFQLENKGSANKSFTDNEVNSSKGSCNSANARPFCVYCKISFGSKAELTAHATHNHKTGEVYDCSHCMCMMYMSSEKWILHVKSHQSGSRGTCSSDSSEEKVVSLETCPDISNIVVETRLPRTDGAYRNLLDDAFHCEFCPRTFHLKESYIRHRRIHTGERPYLCTECGKDFRNPSGLTRHRKDVHEGLKKFGCDLCGRHFASRATMEDHRRIHTGERPYICDSCGKAFKSKASLYVHSRTHITTYPFPCSHCDKKFRRKQEFDVHFKIHTGEKSYVCDICGKRFRVHYEMSRHRLIHSDEKPFECKQCGLQFRQKRYLRNHNISQHSGKACESDEVSQDSSQAQTVSSVQRTVMSTSPPVPVLNMHATTPLLPLPSAPPSAATPFTPNTPTQVPPASAPFVPSPFMHMPSSFMFGTYRD